MAKAKPVISEIVVDDPANVRVNGVPAGSMIDVLLNWKDADGVQGALNDAFRRRDEAKGKERADEIAAREAAQEERRAKLVARHEAKLAEMEAWHASRVAELTDALAARKETHAAELVDALAAHEAKLAEAEARHAAKVEDLEGRIGGLQATISELGSALHDRDVTIELMGGSVLAKRLAVESRRERAEAARLKAEAELAAAEAEDASLDGVTADFGTAGDTFDGVPLARAFAAPAPPVSTATVVAVQRMGGSVKIRAFDAAAGRLHVLRVVERDPEGEPISVTTGDVIEPEEGAEDFEGATGVLWTPRPPSASAGRSRVRLEVSP